MKKKLIILLTGINVCLLAAVLYIVAVPRANAQANRGGADYIAVSAKFDRNTEAIYVLDTARSKMSAMYIDSSKIPARTVVLRPRDISRDFSSRRER